MRLRLLLAFLAAGLAAAQPNVPELLEQKTLSRIRALDDAQEGALGVAAIDLTTGRTLAYHADAVFPTASTIKTPVMMELFRQVEAGLLRFDQRVPLAQKDLVDGSLRLQPLLARGPASATVRELLEDMIEVSDNTAANKLIDMLGMARVNALLDEMGFPKTRLRRRMMDTAAAARDEENVSTPLEEARLAELLYRGKAVDEAASAQMLQIMKRVEAGMRRAVPAAVEVAAKPGDLPGARCEMGVVFLPKRPFALAVMSAYIRDERDPVPEVTALVYTYFDKLAHANSYGRRLD
jgi:beta-lactamase class A